jgi:hypothetical protein
MNAAAQVLTVAGRSPRWGRSGTLALIAMALLVCAAGCGDSSLPAASRSTPEPIDSRATTATAAETPAASARTSTTATTASVASTSTTPTTATPSAPDRRPSPRPAVARSQAIRDITFDTVKLDMKKGDPFKRSLITTAIEKLDGTRIRIRGYILPPFQQSGLTRFVLVRDNMACCFGPGAAIYDSMFVELKPGQTTDYTIAPIMIEGTFNIHEVEGIGGKPISIYHVLADKVE